MSTFFEILSQEKKKARAQYRLSHARAHTPVTGGRSAAATSSLLPNGANASTSTVPLAFLQGFRAAAGKSSSCYFYLYGEAGGRVGCT
jgi:hypothetical protein